MAQAPYREFWKPRVNIPQDRRIAGAFSLAANGTNITLGTFTRPSQGSSAAPGIGNMFTVTQPSIAAPQFLVTLNEQQLQPIAVKCELLLVPTAPGTASTPPAAPTYSAQPRCEATAVDVPSNSFYITLLAAATGNTLAATVQPPAGYTWQISFEEIQKPTFSPASL